MFSQKLQDDLIAAYQKVYEEKKGHAAGDSDIEKQASQLASDVRYKAKGKSKPGASKEELRKLYISILGSSPAPSAVKSMAKDKLLGEEKVQEGMGQGMFDKNKIGGAGRQIKKKAVELPKFKDTDNPDFKKSLGNPKKGKVTPPEVKKDMENKDKQFGVTSEGSAYGITKGDGMSFPERMKKKAKEKKKKEEMKEEKKELPTTKMYRKAGNLSRKALSKGLDSKEGSKAQKRSEKIVSTISTAKEKERFSKMTTPKAQLRNEEVVDEKKLVFGKFGNFISGQKKETPKKDTLKPQDRYKIPEGMDPVGKEDKDIDNDGDHDSTDKYLLKRRKAIGKAIAKKRGKVKEGFSAWRIDLDFNEQVKK